MGVTTDGERDILGIWAGDGTEGAKFWLHVHTEVKNRGVDDVLIAVCDGLKGLPEAITTLWERPIVQQCISHLIRNSFRYAARPHRDGIVKALKPVYTAPTEPAARERCGTRGAVGWPLPGDREAVGVRVGRVRALPQPRRRGPQGHLHGRARPQALPQRGLRATVSLPGAPVPRPDRRRPGALDDPVEARTERIRHHLRRPTRASEKPENRWAHPPFLRKSRAAR